MPVRRRVDKEDAAHIGDGILLGCKKEGNLTFATVWMDPENIMLSDISHSEKDKYHKISLTCGI